MAEKQCNLIKNGGGMSVNEGGSITFIPNYTRNQCVLVKLGNLVIGKLNFFNSNNTMSYVAQATIGTMPYKPTLGVNVLMELSGGGTLSAATMDITENGEIKVNQSMSNGRYFSSATFVYFTND